MVLYWSALSCRVRIALSLNKGALEPCLIIRERGVLSDRFALLLPPILLRE